MACKLIICGNKHFKTVKDISKKNKNPYIDCIREISKDFGVLDLILAEDTPSLTGPIGSLFSSIGWPNVVSYFGNILASLMTQLVQKDESFYRNLSYFLDHVSLGLEFSCYPARMRGIEKSIGRKFNDIYDLLSPSKRALFLRWLDQMADHVLLTSIPLNRNLIANLNDTIKWCQENK